MSPHPQGPRRCPPRAPAPGSYLHAGHRQRALQPVLPVLLRVRVKQHIAHLGRGDPVRRLLGPESPCWACLGASPSTSISHPQGPGEQGHSGLKQETPPPQFHTDTEGQTHICPQQVRHGVSVRGLSSTAPKGDNPNIYRRVSGHGNGCTFTARSHTATSGQTDTRLTTGFNLQHTPVRRSRTAESTLLHNMDMKLQKS